MGFEDCGSIILDGQEFGIGQDDIPTLFLNVCYLRTLLCFWYIATVLSLDLYSELDLIVLSMYTISIRHSVFHSVLTRSTNIMGSTFLYGFLASGT